MKISEVSIVVFCIVYVILTLLCSLTAKSNLDIYKRAPSKRIGSNPNTGYSKFDCWLNSL